jgi:hypothetical protein
MIKFGSSKSNKPPAVKAEKPAEPKPSKAKFDRNAYQREYMRKRREAARKDKP